MAMIKLDLYTVTAKGWHPTTFRTQRQAEGYRQSILDKFPQTEVDIVHSVKWMSEEEYVKQKKENPYDFARKNWHGL